MFNIDTFILDNSDNSSCKKNMDGYLQSVTEQEDEDGDEIIDTCNKDITGLENFTNDVCEQETITDPNFNLNNEGHNTDSETTICDELEHSIGDNHFNIENDSSVYNEDDSVNLIKFTDILESKESCV